LNYPYFNFQYFNLPKDNSAEVDLSGKDLLVILNQADFDEHESLLRKILTSINYDFESNAASLILAAEEEINIAKLTREHLSHVLVFGVDPKKLGMNIQVGGYQFYKSETFSILVAHKLTKLQKEKMLKKRLWDALQNEFTPK